MMPRPELDDLAKMTDGKDRYIIEVQGFTDKTGSALANEQLSQARAAAVARYLVNEHKIPVRSITTPWDRGRYALPVADDKTREGREAESPGGSPVVHARTDPRRATPSPLPRSKTRTSPGYDNCPCSALRHPRGTGISLGRWLPPTQRLIRAGVREDPWRGDLHASPD